MRDRCETKHSPLFEIASVLVRLGHISRLIVNANYEIHPADTHSKSNEEDKHTSDHQSQHPEQIHVEPGAAQYANTDFFVNQHCQKTSYQKIAAGMHHH